MKKLFIDSAGFSACAIGFFSVTGRTIELLTYSEFKSGVILAGTLGLTAYVLNKIRIIAHK